VREIVAGYGRSIGARPKQLLVRTQLPFARFPALIAAFQYREQSSASMKAYMCVICGYVYEEEKGDSNAGLPPGTKWSDVPLSWRCPDCGAGKEDFEMVEI
jgi:rubredoxin